MSPESSKRKEQFSAGSKLSGRFTFVALLAGLLLLLCSAPSARAHSSPPGCTGSGLGILLFTDAPDVHIGDTLRYSVTIFNGVGSGPVVCDATGIAASVVTPDGVTHPLTLVRTNLSNGQSDFYPNVVSYIVRAQDVRTDGTVRATASDTGTIHQNDTDSQGGGNQGVNTEVSLPCIGITVQCVAGTGENGPITFSGVVTNCGNNTLVGVTVTNFNDNGFFSVVFPTNLARGQSAPFSGSFIPLSPCTADTVVLTALGRDQFTSNPRTVTNSASITCQNTTTPGIRITKMCPVSPVSPGQLLTFSGSVSNTGNVTLTNVVVRNSQPVASTIVLTVASLAPGAVTNFTGSYLAPTNCSVADTLTVTATSRCGAAVTDSATATCPILTTPQIAVGTVCPATAVAPGELLTYTGTVTNTGNITLTNVVVVSDRPSANTTVFTAATLAPGASANFTGSYTVPTNACFVIANIRATGQNLCTGVSVTNLFQSNCNLSSSPALAVTLTCPAVPATNGGSITFTGTVRNSGNVTLNNVTVVNNQPGTNTVVFTVASMAPGAITNFTASFITPANDCSVTGTVTATATNNCTGGPVSTSASATCPLSSTPSIVVTQVCPIIPATPGSTLTYSGTVRNSGNITLTNVVVLNNLSGTNPIFTAVTLAAGATANFTGSYLAPTNCSSTSTSTATGRSVCGIAVTNTVSATCTILTAPQIVVTAVCPTAPVLPGGSLTYSGTVRNSGNITLTNVVVVSDRPVANTTVFTAATLAPGASSTFTGTYTVPTNACAVTTTFRGTGQDICTANSVTNSVSTTCEVTTAPNLAVTLTCPPTSASTGGSISFTGTVRNTGNVTLTNVTVVRNQPAPSTVILTLPSLPPGAVSNFTATFIATTNACAITATVTATGSDFCRSVPITNSASATCVLITTPGIRVTKTCPVQPVSPGQMLTFSGTVSNTGNITLTNIVVVNNQPTNNTPVFMLATLAPGAVTNFTGSYLAPTNCSVADTLTATGRSICGDSVTNLASATCPILTAPDIEVTLTCPLNPPPLGGTLTYTGTVRNSGNITLTNIFVMNSRTGTNRIFTAVSLAPGAVLNFTGSYTVPPNCCIVSSTVTASGQGCDGRVVTDSASSTCPVLTMPVIMVTKVCTSSAVAPGQLLTYSGIITNAGDISLTDVYIVNNVPTNNSPVLGPVTLAPGESMSYTASYIVPPDFCGTDTVTARGTACGRTVTNSVTSSCPITPYSPSIAVTKNCPLTPTPRGGIMTYTGTVFNTGNITLINVFVVSNEPVPNTPVLGPITLAPGASSNFTASFLTPTDCCEIPTTLNARGQDKCAFTTVTARVSDVCPLLTIPGIMVVQNCPLNPIPMGSLYNLSGYVTNTGDVNLTNVMVFGPQGTNLLLGPMELAPGESETFTSTYLVPSNTCFVTIMSMGQSVCGATSVTNTSSSCPVACDGSGQPAQPVISGVSRTNGTFRLSFVTENGESYTVQFKNSLSDLTWTDLPGMPIAGNGGVVTVTDSAVQPMRFYRVVVAP